jgi:hypothetical protein
MRSFRLAAAAILLMLPSALVAQTPVAVREHTRPRLVHGDVAGTLGWLSANVRRTESYDDWYNRGFFGGLSFGWYWTDHLKTEVGVSASNGVRVWVATPMPFPDQRFYTSELELDTRRLSVHQHYQFGTNQWVHPFLAAGVDVVAEGVSRRDGPVYGYDPVTRQSQLVRPATDYPRRTDWQTFASVSGGMKAYATQRVFFLTDLRVTFARRPEEVLLRLGLGVDF